MGRVGNHGDHNLALLSYLFSVVCSHSTAAYNLIYRILIEIKNNQLIASL